MAEKTVGALEALVDNTGPFLCGPEISLADLHLAPIMAYFSGTPEGKKLLSRRATPQSLVAGDQHAAERGQDAAEARLSALGCDLPRPSLFAAHRRLPGAPRRRRAPPAGPPGRPPARVCARRPRRVIISNSDL